MDIKKFLKLDNIPDFIKTNPILTSIEKVDKVFPKIGLPNCKEKINIDPLSLLKTYATNVIADIGYHLSTITNNHLCMEEYDPYRYDILSVEDRQKSKNIGVIARNLNVIIGGNIDCYTRCISIENGALSIRVPKDVLDIKNNIVIREGQSLFKAYNYLIDMSSKTSFANYFTILDHMQSFKDFSSNNISTKDLNIVFSSDDEDGLWDIATMSMRGFRSCQSWDGQYKNNLIGSIVDPFVGVIYLEGSGKGTQYGSKMIRRCIVRFVADSKNNKPAILIDRMYPQHNKEVADAFVSFIKNKTNLNVLLQDWSVGQPDLNTLRHLYIPFNNVHTKLNDEYKSYRDTKIPYKIENKMETVLEKNIKNRQTKFKNTFSKIDFRKIKTKSISSVSKSQKNQAALEKVMRNEDTQYLIKNYFKEVAEKCIVDGPKQEDFSSSDEYLKKVMFYYMNNKDKFKFSSKIFNDYFQVNFTDKICKKMLLSFQNQIDKKMKEALKEIISQRSKKIKIP